MTVLSRLIERRSAGDPFRDAWFGGDDVSSFGALTPKSAARISTVYSCWRIVTDSFAALPVDHFRKDGGRRTEVDPAWLIVTNPSGLVDRIGWVTQYAMSMLSDGNAFGAVLATDRSGWPTHVEWLSPTAVGVELKGGRKLFRVGDTVYRDDEIVHIPWLIQPGGLRGLSPLGALREWTQAQKGGGEYLAEFFEGGGHPTAILSTSQRIDAAVAGQVVWHGLQAAAGIACRRRVLGFDEVHRDADRERVGCAARACGRHRWRLDDLQLGRCTDDRFAADSGSAAGVAP